MSIWNEKTTYETYYSFNGEPYGRPASRPGVRLHYNDWTVGSSQRYKATLLANTVGIGTGSSVAMIGAGFAWTGEGLVTQGAVVACTDLSTWIQSSYMLSEENDLVAYITSTGLQADDEIIGPPDHPETVLKIPQYKRNQFDAWIVGPEADNRREEIARWNALPDSKREYIRQTNPAFANYNPIMPTSPKPEWMINPLDLYKRGGRDSAQPRTSITILNEDSANLQSRTVVANKAGGSLTHIVTEELLNNMPDREALDICDTISVMSTEKNAARGTQIIHILSPLQPARPIYNDEGEVIGIEPSRQRPEVNWKLYSDWRIFLDNNGFSDHKIMPSVSVQDKQAYKEIF